MEREQESVVEVAFAAQRAVVDVSLLLVVFVSVEPPDGRKTFLLLRQSVDNLRHAAVKSNEAVFFCLLPFNVDIAHLLPADADIIQDDIAGVPDDATQEEPEQKQK